MGNTPPQTSVARVTVNLPERVWEALSKVAEEDNITRTEALRRAISIDLYLREQRSKGSHVLLERPDGAVERIVFPY